jgi:hypothetical protein
MLCSTSSGSHAVLLAALFCSACGSAPPAPPGSPAVQLDALKAQHVGRHPTSQPLAALGGSLPRGVEVSRAPGSYAQTKQDFKRWCASARGTLYEAPGAALPENLRAGAEAASTVFKGASSGNAMKLDVSTCAIDGRGYSLVTAIGYGLYAGAAWLTPDETAQLLPAANAALQEKQRMVDAKLAAHAEKRDAEVRQNERNMEKREAARLEFLTKSPKGTQASCSELQRADEPLKNLQVKCGEFYVSLAEFNTYGWRITSQSMTPSQTTHHGTPVNLISVIVEKVR